MTLNNCMSTYIKSADTSGLDLPCYIYESPDGGETVYRRLSGSSERDLIKVSNAQQYTHWREIVSLAQNDEYLRDLLDRAESYYRLKYAKD